MALTAPEPSFNADMLVLARDLSGMTQSDAANAAGITRECCPKWKTV
jgi:DNA-binding XRE family transcriptional regulator